MYDYQKCETCNGTGIMSVDEFNKRYNEYAEKHHKHVAKYEEEEALKRSIKSKLNAKEYGLIKSIFT
jgi:predicted methyltransferase